jgi:hypothetical protein
MEQPKPEAAPKATSLSVAPVAAGVAVGIAAVAAIAAFVLCKRRAGQPKQDHGKMASPAGFDLPMSPHGYGVAMSAPVQLTSLAPSVSDDTASTYSLPTVSGPVAGTDGPMYRI